ncbi:MAG: hypothetical protein IIV97_01115 [Oscillospiraceae bacterium]|nr:hypothetical protein [Oscillospiraceae bacterium]
MKKKALLIVLAVIFMLSLSACDKTEKMLKEAEVGDVITFGTYEQDNDEANGKEPIEWRVLAKDEEKVLLLTDKVIDSIPFNNEMQEWITWEDSSLRAWLGGEFVTAAFSEEEAARILETSNPNDENRDYGIPATEDTLDTVFLLSIRETTEYFKTDENSAAANEDCIAYPTEYAIAKDIEVRNGGAVMWWLRECTSGVPAAACDDLGKRFHNGRPMDYTRTGVRPAMWVKIEMK